MKKLFTSVVVSCALLGNAYADQNTDRLQAQCDSGSGESCGWLANLYATGNGAVLDAQRASELRQKACTLGYTLSCSDGVSNNTELQTNVPSVPSSDEILAISHFKNIPETHQGYIATTYQSNFTKHTETLPTPPAFDAPIKSQFEKQNEFDIRMSDAQQKHQNLMKQFETENKEALAKAKINATKDTLEMYYGTPTIDGLAYDADKEKFTAKLTYSNTVKESRDITIIVSPKKAEKLYNEFSTVKISNAFDINENHASLIGVELAHGDNIYFVEKTKTGEWICNTNPHWMIDTTSGCEVWNSGPVAYESVSWTGTCKNNKADGKGVLHWAIKKVSKDRYEGDYKNGRMHGKGTYIWTNGDKYDGDWSDNKRTGKGTFIKANGGKYIGDLVDGVFHGKGVLIYNNGNKYDGDFVDGKRTGKGTWTSTNGTKYVGDWVDDKMHGKGTWTFADGTKYVGDLVDGTFHGKGMLFMDNGDVFVGEFDKSYSKLRKKGILTKKNQQSYEVEYGQGGSIIKTSQSLTEQSNELMNNAKKAYYEFSGRDPEVGKYLGIEPEKQKKLKSKYSN